MSHHRYFRILGLPATATLAEVRQAYRRRARESHPDLNPGNPDAEREQRELNDAYGALCQHLENGNHPASGTLTHDADEPDWQGTVPPWGPFGPGPWPFEPAQGPFGPTPGAGPEPWSAWDAARGRDSAWREALLLARWDELERELAWHARGRWANALLDEALDHLATMAFIRWRRGW